MNELAERLFQFSINTIKLLKGIKYSDINRVFVSQLTKSATSVGANYEEAQAASSKSDFTNKVNISLKEIRESNYWLRIISELNLVSENDVKPLLTESNELMKILGKIVFTSRQPM